jgi:ATP-dependent DNA helicase RecG
LSEDRLRALGLSDRLIAAVNYVKEHGSINNQEYRALAGVKERMATLDLKELVDRGVLVRLRKTGRGTRYAATKAQNTQ